jgi:uncharacterized protein
MGRFLVLVLIVVAIVWLVRRAFRAPDAEEVAQKPAVQGDLVSCARCGVHLPRGEAREAGGALYCTDEHARLGRGGRG